MYQKFLPQGSIGIQVLVTKNFDLETHSTEDIEIIDNHTLSIPSFEQAVVEDHTLVIDSLDDFELA